MLYRALALLLTLLYAGYTLPLSAQEGALVFGVYPVMSPSQTVTMFTPLTEHLSSQLGQPVSLRSAPSFGEFVQRTHAGEYDIIYTAPHMGRLANLQDGYLPVAQTDYQLVITALTGLDSPIQSLQDMANRKMAIGSKLSMTYQIINLELKRFGLELEKSVGFVHTASFSNVPKTIMRQEADAGATGTVMWTKAPAEERAALREIFRSDPVPGLLVLAHSRIQPDQLNQLRQAFIGFSTEGMTQPLIVSRRGFIEFSSLDESTLKRLDPYVEVLLK